MTIVYGVDPSLSRTGLARCVSDSDSVGWNVTNRGSSAVGDDPWDLCERFDMLTGLIIATLDDWAMEDEDDPAVIAMEGPSYGSSASGVMNHRISGYWWAMAAALKHWCHVYTPAPALLIIPPTTLKKYVTGNGNAGKDEVLLSVSRLYPNAAISNNDEADAVALAGMGTRWIGGLAESLTLPQKNLGALKGLARVPAR